jgi:hypothetical protein
MNICNFCKKEFKYKIENERLENKNNNLMEDVIKERQKLL